MSISTTSPMTSSDSPILDNIRENYSPLRSLSHRISAAKIALIGTVAFAVFALGNLPTASAGPLAYHACAMGCAAIPPLYIPCIIGCQILRFTPGP